MPNHFDLIITSDVSSHTAEFSLCDATGRQLGHQKTAFHDIPVSQQRGLFDLREHLRLYVEAGQQQAAVAAVGVCIAEKVLGETIFPHLWKPTTQRTLRIQLPGAGNTANPLATALARVPWEIARRSATDKTLGERNLVVRVVHDMQTPASQPIALDADEALRVLFVFAESRGSRPLGARQERRELLALFEKDIYPKRRIVAHFLTHGVTRERLAAQIQDNGGYHIVHWSGHGHMNLLELCQPDGASDHLSGEELLDLFTGSGGFLPRLFFLSACHSGDILRVKDWADFLAVAQGQEPGTKPAEAKAASPTEAHTKDHDLQQHPGYTGTAHALLQGGVPSVVAMRYAVGDDYARELAVAFYRALLAHQQPKNVAAALTLARQALLAKPKQDATRFHVCDHATPVLYGAEQPDLHLPPGRSPAQNPRSPRLHPLHELTTAAHAHFVGRTWELVGLGADFIGSSTGNEVKPVAVITGLGGMGKTALTAEVLALWESRFEWVLLYQAKPNRLEFDATLRDIHLRLLDKSDHYRTRVQSNSRDAVWLDAEGDFKGQRRNQVMLRNLVDVLRVHAILIVLDNFETHLKEPDPATQLSACQDPTWDDCLALLARELVGSPSRVLITSRRPLAALAGVVAHAVPLGPLPGEEAALYLRAQPTLSRMVFGQDSAEKALAMRLLHASRFHPLLMDRLAKLAAQPSLRPQLLEALHALENTKNFAQLPALFVTAPGDNQALSKNLAYLDDALATSLDQLIRSVGPDARRLLWVISMANQPEALGLVADVWSGESPIQKPLALQPTLPSEHQAKLKEVDTPEFRARLDALPPERQAQPALAPLLGRLVSVGLVTEERETPDDANPNLTCHELVRERTRAWMEQQPTDRATWTENAIRLAYAERLEWVFQVLLHQDMSIALQAGSRALVYCVQAEVWDRLLDFASGLITSTQDPALLATLIPHLQTAAEAAPEGRPRWSCLCYLGDALQNAGRPDTSLTFFEQAAAQARTAAEAGGQGSQQAWADLGTISGNWAFALRDVGNLDAARQCQLDSAEAKKKASSPAINIIGSELEALRIDIMQGQAASALPEVEARLTQIAAWWQQHRSGQPVPEAPDAEFLARAYIGALDIATDTHVAQEDWPAALLCIDAILEVKHALKRSAQDIASDRMNRANVLVEMPGRFGEAKAELEACLTLFENRPDWVAKVRGSLAELFHLQGDMAQAITQARRALALCDALPGPADRAISHNNLANYLQRSGTPADNAESPRHQLAELVYSFVAGLRLHLQTSLNNYGIYFRRAHAVGTELAVPRLAALLADPAFAPLAQWLAQRQVPLDALQADVDDVLNQVREAAITSSTP